MPSLDIESFAMESFFMPSLDMESLAMPSLVISSTAKAETLAKAMQEASRVVVSLFI